jgi:hypothetical protein
MEPATYRSCAIAPRNFRPVNCFQQIASHRSLAPIRFQPPFQCSVSLIALIDLFCPLGPVALGNQKLIRVPPPNIRNAAKTNGNRRDRRARNRPPQIANFGHISFLVSNAIYPTNRADKPPCTTPKEHIIFNYSSYNWGAGAGDGRVIPLSSGLGCHGNLDMWA